MPETIYEMSKRLCGSTICEDCPLKKVKGRACLIGLIKGHKVENAAEQLEVLRKWAEEHPVKAYVKTYKDVLLERLPSVAMLEDDVPCICRNSAFGIDKVCLDILLGTHKCKDCWNEPYKE